MIIPVILSGGSGTRLWPLSTAERPKQFLPLVGDTSLFRQTLDRAQVAGLFGDPVVVANAGHEELCYSEIKGRPQSRLILEPAGRNTAAAIIGAAEVVQRIHGPEALMLVMPSDHRIGRPSDFVEAVKTGRAAADSGRLVTFGVTATAPDTGYGYLEKGNEIAGVSGAYGVARFTEKPDAATAREMLSTGRYFWNGGIFLFKAGIFLQEAQAHAPDVFECVIEAIANASESEGRIWPEAEQFKACPSISVDYAVMERSDKVAMVPLDADWSDVGSWDVLADLDKERDDGFESSTGSSNCYVRSDGLKIALLGVDDLIVVASGDQVLIMRKGRSQDIRQLVAEVAARH